MARMIKEVPVGDSRKAIVRELTLDEIRQFLDQAPQARGDIVDALFSDQDLLLSDLPFFTDIKVDELGGVAPSELEDLFVEIRTLNKRFFVTWQQRLTAVRAAMTEPSGLPETLLP